MAIRFQLLTLVMMVLFVGPLVTADDPNAEVVKKENPKLEGTWVVVKSEVAGIKDDSSSKVIRTYTFKDSKVIIKNGDEVATEAPFEIDPKKSPKTIDFDFPVKDAKQNPKKEKTPGIYKFEGEMLIVCHTVWGFPRPKKFSTDEKEKSILITMKRELPAKE